MKNEVFWTNPGYKPRPALQEDLVCDYLIVGGGIMGVTTAYFLNKLGAKNIVLIEKNTVGSGATGKSAGFLALKGELDLQQIIKNYGRKKGLIYWKGNRDGLNVFRDIVKKERIACDFELQNTIYGSIVQGKINKPEEVAVLEEYIVEKDIEKDSQIITGEELLKEIKTPIFSYALKSYGHGASVNPLKFVQKLSQIVERRGVRVFENTKMLRIGDHQAITPGGKIKFKKAIVAIDIGTRSKDVKVLRSTITISEKLSPPQLKKLNLNKHKMIWDSNNVYHYLKITGDNRILLGYGDKKTRKRHPNTQAHEPHVKDIERFLRKLFPQSKIKIEYAWSGNLGVTNDRIPIIEEKKNRITISGASSQVVCAMTAKHISHKLMHKPAYLDDFFNHVQRIPAEFGLFHFIKHPNKKRLKE